MKADYTDKPALTRLLTGVHTVLCFTSSYADTNSVGQKTLIDASIAAGVKRFAPNEWGRFVNPIPVIRYLLDDEKIKN